MFSLLETQSVRRSIQVCGAQGMFVCHGPAPGKCHLNISGLIVFYGMFMVCCSLFLFLSVNQMLGTFSEQADISLRIVSSHVHIRIHKSQPGNCFV